MVIPHHLSKSPSIIYLFNPRLLDGHCACFGECRGPRGPESDVWRQPLYKYVLVSTRKKEILVSGLNAYSAGSQACKWSWCLMVIVSCPYTRCMVGGCKSLCQISQEGLHGGDPAASLKWDPTLLSQQSAPHFGWLFCFASFSIHLSLDSFPQIERMKMNVVWKSHAQHRVGAP